MRIAVLGTGTVGRALAGRLVGLDHLVVIGTRDPGDTLAREGPDSFAAWHRGHPGVQVATYAEAPVGADLVVNATPGTVSLEVLTSIGADVLDGAVLMDVSNPLDFSDGFPPRLAVSDTWSLAEQIQHAFPRTRVIKTLNTVNASLMVDPAALGTTTTVFVSGDDTDAKSVVIWLLESFGHRDIIDLGGIETARGVELYLPLWLRLMGALGTVVEFNIRVVR